jgi:F-type H+-transporting ATPase subunit delta
MAEISTIARPYAQAIFDLAKDQKKLNDWSEMLKLLSGVVENDSIKSVIQDSKILESDKEKLLFNICQKKISGECENLIKLLIENKRLLVLPFISDAFESLKANEENSVSAKIIVATKITKKETDEIVKNLEKKLNKKIEASVEIDESILGGSVITVGDTVIDASVKGQLQSLAFSMKA